MRNFNYVWNWKAKVESSNFDHILDSNYRRQAYSKLCEILPKWQTYRNGRNDNSLATLKASLDNISEDYNLLRRYTLLDFERIPCDVLEKLWNELGRVKEYEGAANYWGRYSIVAVTKPLLLIWGQTPAFDSNVRNNTPSSYAIPKYSSYWTFKDWTNIMSKLSVELKANSSAINFMVEESSKMYGQEAAVPYGRFLDIYFWVAPCSGEKGKGTLPPEIGEIEMEGKLLFRDFITLLTQARRAEKISAEQLRDYRKQWEDNPQTSETLTKKLKVLLAMKN